MYAKTARSFRIQAMVLLFSAVGLAASACGNVDASDDETESPTQVEVTVSLYSGMDNPTIQVPEADYDEIVACIQNASLGSEVAGAYGIPAFVINGDGGTFYVQESGVVKETSSKVVSLNGCGEAFDELTAAGSEQLTAEELKFLKGKEG